MLEKVKSALRITSSVFDDELNNLITSARLDLGIAGVEIPSPEDAIVETAIITYCKMHFGTSGDKEKLKLSYDEQKAQLSMATGYTDWGV